MTTIPTVGWPQLSKVLADPYAYYDEIRAAGPITRSDRTGAFVVTGFAEATALFKHEAVRSDLLPRRLRGADEKWQDASSRLRLLVGQQMAFKDGAEHKRIRDVVRRAFSPTAVRSMAEPIRELARKFAHEAGSRFDFMAAVAYPLPARVINDMLGVPEADHAQFIAWSHTLVEFVGRSAVDDEYLEATQTQLGDWADYCVDLAKSQPPDSTVLSTMYLAHQGDRISFYELLANAMFLLSAAHETTTNLIGNGMLALVRNPEQYELLRARPDLMSSAVEEFLRYDPPMQVTFRITTAPVEVDGYEIPADADLHIVMAAANRDPRAFPDPHRLDITRSGRGNLTFVSGAHTCLGAHLARIEAQQTFAVLTQEMGPLSLDGELRYRPNPTFRGLETFPMSMATVGAAAP